MKVDFNMMIPNDYPRVSPFVRIVNRNPEYNVDSFYKPLKSNTDPSSYILNPKLNTVTGWAPNSSLVNVIIECYNMLRNCFPFSKPPSKYNGDYGQGNAGFVQQPQQQSPWNNLYAGENTNNNNGGSGGWNTNANNGGWNQNANGGNGFNVNNVVAGSLGAWGQNTNNYPQNNNNNMWPSNTGGGMGGINNQGATNNYNLMINSKKFVASSK